ncbi:molybdopterin oxidoreductase family protein [Granulosicoccus sp. 3-233]|uniref:molybdopterin oxidoreductase family protein n=1 Tax=Granulosicoccus sp. 3-233 TaxID=3417969 RepID=UPI003D34F6EA
MKTRTSCPYCGTGCGVTVERTADGRYTVSGDKARPANRGRLCSKGIALAETLSEDRRLLYPEIAGQRVSWYQAIDHVSRVLQETIDEHGYDSVAFYVSGQLLTEDYYVINKLVKGWFGTANIDASSHMGMASSIVAHHRAWGSDVVPGCYQDLESADLVVMVGSNLARCHPVIHQRILAEKQRRPELFLVVIDPRCTATADQADLHLSIQSDGDSLLFNGLLAYLADHDKLDKAYIEHHVSGLGDTLQAIADMSLQQLAERLGIGQQQLETFYRRFANTPATVTLYAQGVNQSESGSDKVSAIINCHLATGRIGKPGMGPFSLSGQANSMGEREVGGLTTMLAAHMEFSDPRHRDRAQRFWDSPRIASDPDSCALGLFKAITDGRIKAVWILGANPVDSLPDADSIRTALQSCPHVIVSEVAESTDTLACATVRLPALPWGEKDGTVTNSERCISRQRALRRPHGEARADWWAVSQVACRMGFRSGFNYASAADIFREHARLSGSCHGTSRSFDISACASLSDEDYQNLAPFYWPWRDGPAPEQAVRFFANGHYFTPDRKARMIPVNAARPGNRDLTKHYPLRLNSGRTRDQWQTMTRTGYSARLSGYPAEPFLAMHPHDAMSHGIRDADIVTMRSPHGAVLLRALLSEQQRPGQVFSSMHWTDEFASQARINSLIGSSVDPSSCQPAYKSQAVSLQRLDAASHGYAMLRHKPDTSLFADIEYWAMTPVTGGWQIEFASLQDSRELDTNLAMRLTKSMQPCCIEPLSCLDHAIGMRRMAVFEQDRLQFLLFTSESPVPVSRSWSAAQFEALWNERSTRWRLLAGRPGMDQSDTGTDACS